MPKLSTEISATAAATTDGRAGFARTGDVRIALGEIGILIAYDAIHRLGPQLHPLVSATGPLRACRLSDRRSRWRIRSGLNQWPVALGIEVTHSIRHKVQLCVLVSVGWFAPIMVPTTSSSAT